MAGVPEAPLSREDAALYTLWLIARLEPRQSPTLLTLDQAGHPGVYPSGGNLPTVADDLVARGLVAESGSGMRTCYALTQAGRAAVSGPVPKVIADLVPFSSG